MSPVSSENPNGQIRPGFLFEPFGWAADVLTAIVIARPTLLADLFSIDCKRMHLIAFALAHLKNKVTPDIGEVLITGSAQAVMEFVPTSYPSSVERVLSRYFPSSILEPVTYRQLILLLNEENASTFLQNADYVSDTVVRTLLGLPPVLRNSCIMNALEPITLEFGFSEGLRLLVSRGAAPNFDVLISEIGSIIEERTLCSRIAELIEALPLPTDLPPSQIQNARRIDLPAEIRALAETRNNRLVEHLERINDGTSAIYLWEDGDFWATCVLERHGRLGWFLDQVRGPQNAEIDLQHCAQLRSAFSQAGFPPSATVVAIRAMYALR
jgi:hypothetical protein